MVERPPQYQKYPDDHVFNKLVRDNVPVMVMNAGLDVVTRIIADDETYHRMLTDKLREEVAEAIEVIESDGQMVDLLEEFADVVEVMHAICEMHNRSLNDILEARMKKLGIRGGFGGRIFLVETKSQDASM